MLTVFVHLPVINNDSENEVSRKQPLAVISKVLRRKSPHQQVPVQGDFNVDWLCVHQSDPLSAPDRESQHAEQRMRLMAWAESHKLQVVLPDACLVPHPDHEATLLAPVSRLNATGAEYALLDFSSASPGLIKSSWLMWWPLRSDHAILVNEILIDEKPPPARQKTKWKPVDANETNLTLRECPFFITMSKE